VSVRSRERKIRADRHREALAGRARVTGIVDTSVVEGALRRVDIDHP
jgi:hypothetical protein